MAKILLQGLGFTCIVLFSTDSNTGMIDPNSQTNIPGPEQLKTADLLFMCKTAKNFTTTMGVSMDLVSEDLRRILVNASYWALGIEAQIAEKSNAEVVGVYEPIIFGFNKFKRGIQPSDFNLK